VNISSKSVFSKDNFVGNFNILKFYFIVYHRTNIDIIQLSVKNNFLCASPLFTQRENKLFD